MIVTHNGKDYDLSDNRDYRRWVGSVNDTSNEMVDQLEQLKRDHAQTSQMVQQAWAQAKAAQESANALQTAANSGGGLGGGGAGVAMVAALSGRAAPAAALPGRSTITVVDGWTYLDIFSPAMGALADPTIDGAAVGNTAGTAFTVAAETGKDHLDIEAVSVQNTPGMTPATDYTPDVIPGVSYNSSSGIYTVTPRWIQIATTVNAAVAAVSTASMHRATLRYRQRSGTLPATAIP